MNEKHLRFLLILCSGILLVCASNLDDEFYTNEWLVHVPYGVTVARKLARKNDMDFIVPDHGNDGYYRMVKREIPLKSFIHRKNITNQLNNDGLITIARQEAVKSRSYRGSADSRHSVVPRSYHTKSKYADVFNDKLWDKMWYLQDFRTDPRQHVVDMNVVPVFLKLGITGEGVNITITDNGFDTSHPDMEGKFKRELSWNYIWNNANILPSNYKFGKYKSHGTKCAGVIIMQPNNTLCGVGVAYGANIGGIKFSVRFSTNAKEAKVLTHALGYVSIYSNSWGPLDNGIYMKNLPKVIKKSFEKSIIRGRNGKGTIYVFSAGNGKSNGDNCACDEYVNSIYTVVVAGCDDKGHVTQYSERCAAIMTTAYSGDGFKKNIVTTDLNGECTEKFTGTSAAVPLVSGIIALGLSANPTLSWRDVQHLIAWTSQMAPLSDNYGWNLNAAGFYYSVDFGFGLMDAYMFVQEAQKWKNVPEVSSCGMRLPTVKGFLVSRNSAARITVTSDGCKGLAEEINFLEHVQLVVKMSYSKRGDIQITMKSPEGTECSVLESRPYDFNKKGLRTWTFTILAFWGESPNGHFVINIYDKRVQPRFTQPVSNEVENHDVPEMQDAERLVDDHLDFQVQDDDKKERVEYVQITDNVIQNVLAQHGETSRKNDAK